MQYHNTNTTTSQEFPSSNDCTDCPTSVPTVLDSHRYQTLSNTKSRLAIVTTQLVGKRIRNLLNDSIESMAKCPSHAETASNKMTRNKIRRPAKGTPINQTTISSYLSPQQPIADDQTHSMTQPPSIFIPIAQEPTKSPPIVMTETTDDDAAQEGSIPGAPETNGVRVPPAGPNFDDDYTVYTRGSNHRPVRHSKINEMTVKITAQSKTSVDTNLNIYNTMNIFRGMVESFPGSLDILDKQGRKVEVFPCDSSTFHQHFTIHNITQTARTPRPHQQYVLVTVKTTVTLREIRNKKMVADALHNSGSRLAYYPWPPTTADVVSIGFFVAAIPKYQMSEDFQNRVRYLLASRNNKKERDIPEFRCTQTTVSAYQGQTRITCQAFDLQVQRQNAQKVIDMAQQAFGFKSPNSLAFMMYKARHENANAFNSAVIMQAKYIESRRIVAVKGISSEEMFLMEDALRKEFPKIQEIYATPMTDKANAGGLPIGRHNFLCNRSDYMELAREIRDTLQSFTKNYCEQRGISKGTDSEVVGLARPLQKGGSVASDETGNTGVTGRASFLSAWTVGMAEYKDEFMTDIPTMIYAHVTEKDTPISEVTPQSIDSKTDYGPRIQTDTGYGRTYAKVVSEARNPAHKHQLSRSMSPKTPQPPPLTTATSTQIEAMEATVKELQQQNNEIRQQLAEMIAMMAIVTTQLTPTVTTRSPPRERKKSRISSIVPTPTKNPGTEAASATAGEEDDETMSEDSQKDYHSTSTPDDKSEMEEHDNHESH